MSPPLMVTEDTPPDMLAGAMDLRLVLPNGSRVKMSVDRRTPMMDLLVQVTTAYKISPAGHVLQPYGETGLLPYKPSTPIGALDTWTVHIVPKHQALQNPANKINLKQIIQPFEQTFRFQVNLPRNQLYVTRVNGRTTMGELLEQACREKGLDTNKYALKHPKQLDGGFLCEDLSLAEYGHNQVCLVSRRALPSSVSTEDILAMQQQLTIKSNSNKSSSRSLSPDSSSVSPRQPVQPLRPLRKRRPAPKPPAVPNQQQQQQNDKSSTMNQENSNEQEEKPTSNNNGPVICHSRTSSDSSGYHEASVLSESPDSNNSSLPDSLPRRSKLPSNDDVAAATTSATTSGKQHNKHGQKLSRSLSNLHQASTSANGDDNDVLIRRRHHMPPPPGRSQMKAAQSTSSLVPSRKKKPAPPPPVFSIAEEREETSSTTSTTRSSKTLPISVRMNAETTSINPLPICPSPATPSVDSAVVVDKPIESTSISHNVLPTFPIDSSQIDQLDTTTNQITPIIKENQKIEDENHDNSDTSSIVTPSETERIEAEIERMFDQATREHVSLESGVDLDESPPDWLNLPPSLPPKTKLDQMENNRMDNGNDVDPFMDWEYKLPAPPTFRDESNSPSLTEYSTMTCGKMKEVLFETTNNNRNLTTTINDEKTKPPPKIAFINELSTAVVDKNKFLNKSENSIVNTKTTTFTSALNNFHITTYNDDNEQKNITTKKKSLVKIMDNVDNDKVENFEKINTMIVTESIYKPINNQLATKSFNDDQSINVEKLSSNTNIVRTSSFIEENRNKSMTFITNPIKRSVSYVSGLSKDKLNISKSNSNLLMENFNEENHINKLENEILANQQSRLNLRPIIKSNLRKTISELSINRDDGDVNDKVKTEPGLQSLQVLRSILPQISQSQGSMNKVGLNTESSEINIKEEIGNTSSYVRPTISVSTWGERPKRQVSIKSDRDYVFGQKVILKPVSQVIKTNVPLTPSQQLQQQQQQQQQQVMTSSSTSFEKRNKPSVYKQLETGNTKPIKLQLDCSNTGMVQLGQTTPPQTNTMDRNNTSSTIRLPIVRSVELKKPYQIQQQQQQPTAVAQLPPPTPQTVAAQPQQKPVPSYLFGCQPKLSIDTYNNSNTTTSNNNNNNRKFTSIVGINQQQSQTPQPPPPPIQVMNTAKQQIIHLKPATTVMTTPQPSAAVIINRTTVTNGQILPPPPPLPFTIKKHGLRNHNQRPLTSQSQTTTILDPREELLRSIRSFGGRDSLRKVSTR